MQGSLNAYAEALSAELGLAEPLPLPAAAAAQADPRYRRFLLRAKGSTVLLADLIRSAPSVGAKPERSATPSTARLAADALSSMLTWSKQGFRPLPKAAVDRRLAACGACPHLSAAPDRLDYRLATLGVADSRICTLCGCPTERKAGLPHERCPSPALTDSTLSRWGEPYVTIV